MKLTSRQKEVLQIIGTGVVSGPVLHKHFGGGLVGFYSMMSKLEEAGLLVAENRQILVEGQPITERWYRVGAIHE